uniref:Radical SAM core domain-containing protein n=1 Tax=Timema monikensis TaxID=170555 RepID=A0A7R9HMY2_9NEOP|nr:unnamed protein product [Timema monikensis]
MKHLKNMISAVYGFLVSLFHHEWDKVCSWRRRIVGPVVMGDLGRGFVPRSVNYHLTRQCNYQCGFCFHTAKTSFVLPRREAECGLRLLKDAGTPESPQVLLGDNYSKRGAPKSWGPLQPHCVHNPKGGPGCGSHDLTYEYVNIDQLVSQARLSSLASSQPNDLWTLLIVRVLGMEKVNFSGGEPFLPERGRYLGNLVRFCKEELGLSSVSIVSNGSLISESWFRDYGKHLDILAISCDSFHEETNKMIGRRQGNRNHVEKLRKIRNWCGEYHVAFKINTVVNTFNIDEDMAQQIQQLNPIRWKVFQCLLLEGENAGPAALRNAQKFYISEEQFQGFLVRHKDVPSLVAEDNTKMLNSYLILDEYMRFLDCREGSKKPSPSILDVGVANALDSSGFDEVMFRKRGGIYKWSKASMELDW